MNSIVSLIKALVVATFGGLIANGVSKAGSAQNSVGDTLTAKLTELKSKIDDLDTKFDEKAITLASTFNGRVTSALEGLATDLAATSGVTATSFLDKAKTLDKFSLNNVVAPSEIVRVFNSKMPVSFEKELFVGTDGVIALRTKEVVVADKV